MSSIHRENRGAAARRTAIACLLGLAGLLTCAAVAAEQPAGDVEVDYAQLVSRADLHYEKPVSRSEEGVPVGNGRMGSLVWTTPEAIRLQINRVDVFANNSYSTSFPARNSDYCGGCAFVDIIFAGEVFAEGKMSQHLACYDGLADVRGDGIAANVLAWNERDVMAFEINDSRNEPAPVTAVLRMLKAPEVKTGAHTVASRIEARDGKIVLTQKFTEADYYCGSVVAIGMVGRKAQVQTADEREIRLAAEAGSGSFTVLVASAASFDPKEDIVAAALKQLAAAENKGYAAMAESNRSWWHDFWSKGYIDLHSEDGVADSSEQNYTYYLYVMASSSRGRFPAKFNGMIWITGGDKRSWGGHYWGANQECMYNALLAANRMELLDPIFDMYSGMYESCSTAARQQWGSQGIYIPETVAFDGLAKLPDDIAAEMRDLYLLKKPWDQRSEQFLAVARTGQPHSSRWNWMGGGSYVEGIWQPTERGGGPYGPVTHIFSRGAKIAYTYWQRYEYTLDETWLRDRAYPMLKGVAEFYRNYPNLKKGEDGRYHLHHVNSNESVQGGQDPDEEIASMMAILPVVIKASEILEADVQMRPVWKELLDNLAPLPTGGSPTVWIRALPPIFRGRGDGRPDGNTMPQWFFDLCTLENDNSETMKIADATMDGYLRSPSMRPGVLSKVGVTAAMMGRADAVRYLLPNQLSFPDRAPVLANRLDQREGQQTTNAQRLGRVADTLHNALIQSVGAGPAKEPVIRVFPAWPREWDAAFTLLARGAFVVSSSMKAGKIEYVRIESQAGGECRLRNPWPGSAVTLRRDGNKAEDLSGSLLAFPTRRGETILATVVSPSPVTDAATNAASAAHLDYEPDKPPRFWSVATAETMMTRWPDYNLAYHASWTYVHGYALYGFDMLYRATGDKRYFDYIKRYIDKHIDENGEFRPVIDGRGRTRPVSFTNQDNMMTGGALVMLYDYTKDERYRKAADTIRRALDGYPRNRNGGLWASSQAANCNPRVWK